MASKSPTQPHMRKPDAPDTAAEAFAKVQVKAKSIPDDQLVPLNVNIPTAVCVAFGALANFNHYRKDIAHHLPHHSLEDIDELGTYAMAAWYAHLVHINNDSARPVLSTQPLLEEAGPLRENLLVAAEALAHRGLLDPESVAEIRAGQGNLDTANDLVALAALFHTNWAKVEGKTAVEPHEVERASILGPELLVALALRGRAKNAKSADASSSSSAKVRHQCYTMFERAYNNCRRALAYVRWDEGDLDELAPSLHARGKSGKSSARTSDEDAALEPRDPIA